ncbi:MAG TPA: hypothetical protein QGH16_05110, partial [Verrucomicrobiota bacterium]|nr:hypothetical protein [Verrucomicrobiota bacterium]
MKLRTRASNLSVRAAREFQMMNEGKKLKTGFQVITVILTLLVFGGAIWGAKEQMSERIRGQVLARYAQELY